MTTPQEPNPPETAEIDTSKLISPNKPEDLPKADPAKVAAESTPVGDEAQEAALAFHAEGFVAPATAEHNDDEDVAAALQRTTQDGKGDEDPGESDWQGYATDGVEAEDA
jgi:hypothetical protein